MMITRDVPVSLLALLGEQFPTMDAALAEIATLSAQLTLPKGSVHVISDVHGEFKKLKHVINNASGSTRPLVERLFAGRLDQNEIHEFLSVVYYPRESWRHMELESHTSQIHFLRRFVPRGFELLRALAHRYSIDSAERVFPTPWKKLFREMLFEPQLARSEIYINALVQPLVAQGRALEFIRHISHAIRNLSVAEIIVAGDLGDRGPRIDKVIDFLMHQSNISIVWGNHDMVWMAACLGHDASIATVIRNSLRYGRLAQLEEGYGIPVIALEVLVQQHYLSDPALKFAPKSDPDRDELLLARMQKAMAIIQFKLEAQLAFHRKEFYLESRALLHLLEPDGTITLNGQRYPLSDAYFPTVDPSSPYELTESEAACMNQLRKSFLESATLWKHMQFLNQRGSMVVIRDHHLIFHGCVPIDENDAYEPMPIDGQLLAGRPLFEKIDRVVHRAFVERRPSDLDVLYYLWAGPRSPCFGKDKMATFESYFVGKGTQKEIRNPYFKRIHDPAFCERILHEFGADPARGLIVNGHVPVKIEAGESPVKNGGRAVTIDGAFSEAYGDRGYTLVLEAEHTYLAQHHHFESVEEAIRLGTDIIPQIEILQSFKRVRSVGDTEEGGRLQERIQLLDQLIEAYRDHRILESSGIFKA